MFAMFPNGEFVTNCATRLKGEPSKIALKVAPRSIRLRICFTAFACACVKKYLAPSSASEIIGS